MADTQINFDIFEAEKHLNNEKKLGAAKRRF